MSRQDQFNCTVAVRYPGDGSFTNLGIFSLRTGGQMDSDSTKYRPGNMAPQESLGGIKSLQNVTVSRRYRHDRDHLVCKKLYHAVGQAQMRVTEIPLDVNGNANGDPITWTGTLKRCNYPDRNANSQDVAMFELELDSEDFS